MPPSVLPFFFLRMPLCRCRLLSRDSCAAKSAAVTAATSPFLTITSCRLGLELLSFDLSGRWVVGAAEEEEEAWPWDCLPSPESPALDCAIFVFGSVPKIEVCPAEVYGSRSTEKGHKSPIISQSQYRSQITDQSTKNDHSQCCTRITKLIQCHNFSYHLDTTQEVHKVKEPGKHSKL